MESSRNDKITYIAFVKLFKKYCQENCSDDFEMKKC